MPETQADVEARSIDLRGKQLRIIGDQPYGYAVQVLDETGHNLNNAKSGIASIDVHITKRIEVNLTMYRASLDLVGIVVGQTMSEDTSRIDVPDTHDIRVIQNPQGGQTVYFERKR